MEKLWYLKKMDIFKGLSDEQYAIIDKDSVFKAIKKHETVPFKGTADHYIYFLKQGKIKIMKFMPDGRAITLDILKEGTLFGEMGLMLDNYYGEDYIAEALENSLLCVMKRENFDRLINSNPSLSKKITKIVGLRIKKIENKLADLLYSTVEERLAKTLFNLSEEFGVYEQNNLVLKIKLTHHDIADLVASTRETVTVVLNRFKRDRIIDSKNKHIIVLDREKLRAIGAMELLIHNQRVNV